MTEDQIVKRSIRKKGVASTRTSKRQVGYAAEEIVITGDANSKDTMTLIKGGMGGRRRSTDTDWNYFANIKTVISKPLSPAERVERNRGVFINVDKLHEVTAATIKEEPVQVSSDSYHVGCLQNIQAATNRMLHCTCQSSNTLDLFVDFCCLDKRIDSELLKKLQSEWVKQRKEIKNEIIYTVKNVGIASTIQMTCSRCCKSETILPQPSKFQNYNTTGEISSVVNSSWYDLNLRLAIGTLASGSGGANMSELFSFLGFPHAKGFHKRIFPVCESKIGASLRKVAKESMDEAKECEVRMQLQSEKRSYTKWKQCKQEQVLLTVSFDMGWSKRSSGHRYDSLSGHAFMCGCRSNMIISAIITAKECHLCSYYEQKNKEPPDHDCPRNYTGSSKAMEPDAALSLYESMFYDSQKKIALRSIVSDDDSTMKALLKHPSNHKRGKLNPEIPEPSWLADPSHRTKVVAKYIFALAMLPKSKSTCTKIDAIRVKKYFGYMIKTNRNSTISEIKIASLAVIEHLFDSHDYCNSRWCRPKRILELREKIIVSKDKDDNIKDNAKLIEMQRTVQSFYRCKVKDKVLYQQMRDAYEPFTKEERLRESLHSYSTQKNEAMNNSVAKYAPKTRTYSTTMALTNRVMIVIGTSNLGYVTFWERFFSILLL